MCVLGGGFFCSLFCLEIAGQHDVIQLGGVQGRRFGRDGLSLGAQGLVECGRFLDHRAFKHTAKEIVPSLRHGPLQSYIAALLITSLLEQ